MGTTTATSLVKSATSVVERRTFAEFFAGIGLMRLGLEAAGWRIAYANDIDAEKYEMYKTNFSDASEHFTLGDIHKLDVGEVPTVTLATASFPCTDLSLAGARVGIRGTQSSAYWGFVRVLEEMGMRRPPLVLLENVTGFLSSHGGEDFKEALLALNDLGYAVDAFVLNASFFVPQSRPRLFVIGCDLPGEYESSVREAPEFYESALRPRQLARFIMDHPEINWRLQEFPTPPACKHKLKDIIDDLPKEDPFWWSSARVEYLLNQMSERHSMELARMKDKRAWSYGTVFRRVRHGKSMAELRTDGIAGCLRTPKGGSGRQILVKAGYGRVYARLLTPRECARLMGADEYVLDTTLNKALFGFGDAVCVPAVTWIAQHCLEPLFQEQTRACKDGLRTVDA